MSACWLDQHAADDPQVRAEVASLLELPLARRVVSVRARRRDASPTCWKRTSALEPGAVIGTYTIEREIGRGGMGHVYLATDARLGRTVALKALPPRLTREEAQRERLRREAQAAAAPDASGHLHRLRARGARRRSVHRLGVRRRAHAARGDRARHATVGRRGARDGTRDRGRARERAREGHHPSRSEAGEHHARRRRAPEDPGLRPRALRPPGRRNACRFS